MKNGFEPGIEKDTQLLYVSEADQTQANYPSLLHLHTDRLELVYVYDGEGIHRIGNNLYSVKAGNLSVFNCNVLHDEMASPDVGMSFFNCAVRGIKIKGLPENHLLADNINPVLQCGDNSGFIENIFRQMKFQLAENKNGAETVCQYLTEALLCIITRQIPLEVINKDNGENELIIQVKEYIDKHYFEKLTFSRMCKIMHISESFLSHKFKKITGFSPIQYITRRRIGKAQSSLISSDVSITDIGAEVGYDSTSYFNMIFKKTVEMAPLEYRRYWIGGEQYRKLDALNHCRI
nr:AraC family transcriptional regulator [Pectinatus sottacetonis]